MLMNNLDPDVAENPAELVVYGGTGKAARNWKCFDAIVRELTQLADDETLLIQSGKPVGVFRTHRGAPRVLIANSNLVGRWATWDHFRELERKGLMMYGQMTAGSWIYIGSQGIDFRAPLAPGKGVRTAHKRVRAIVPRLAEDRVLSDDIRALSDAVADRRFADIGK